MDQRSLIVHCSDKLLINGGERSLAGIIHKLCIVGWVQQALA